ncbi:MAG: hypothetical protein AAGC53_19335 [Actinomycetota bacterium]
MMPQIAMLAELSELFIQLSALATTEIDPDYLDDAGRIIGSPAAGPKPQQSGDRGGFAQLLTLLALFLGVSFVAWRIRREMNKATAQRAS